MTASATRKGAALAWATPILCEAAALMRSVVLARMLGVEELGKAMMLALALRLVEMSSDFSIERLILQAPDGDDPQFRRAMQGAALVRGGVLAGLMLAMALPIAMAFTDGPSTSTMALLALVPLLRGAVHLDYRCRERGFDYRGVMITEGGAALVMLASAPVAAWLIDDHRAFIIVVLAHAAALFALSHIVARTRWQVAFDKAALSRVISFGAPLLANSALMFLIFHGDRMIVAGFFGWAEVGRYAVALQLALLPAQIAGRAAGSLLPPAFRRAVAAGSLNTAARHASRNYLLLGLAFVTGFWLLANPAISLVYGAEFAMSLPVILALGALAGLRIARTPLSQLAVALGLTEVPAKASMLRAAAVPVALCLAWAGMPLATIAAAGAAGEALAALRAAQLLRTETATTMPRVQEEIPS